MKKKPAAAPAGMDALVEGVRPFPHAVERVRKLASDPQSSLAEIARAMEGDVGLSSDVLRLVNAAASGLTQRCTSLRHAASLLGAARIAQIISGAAALAALRDVADEAPAACAHALAVAGVARMLAAHAAVPADDAFAAGLLHDVGAILLLQQHDPGYEDLHAQASLEGTEPNVADERVILGFDHAALGAEVLRKWKMPEVVSNAIEHHHDWDELVRQPPGVLAVGALVVVADVLVPRLATNPTPTREDLDLAETHPAFACIGLTRDAVFAMWEGLRAACTKGESAVFDAPVPKRESGPVPASHRNHPAAPAATNRAAIAIAIGVAVVSASAVVVLHFL
jgi:putative nucleotidyltransferase with HDIG domain